MIAQPINETEPEAKWSSYIYSPTIHDYIELEKFKEECGLNRIDPPKEIETIIPKFNMMNNYNKLGTWKLIPDLFNSSHNLFYLVFKPKNKKYDSTKCFMDHVRKKCGKYKTLIITREKESTKVHYNVLIETTEDLSHMHEKQDSRFFYYCKKVNKTKHDILKVHDYITKESKTRYFRSRNMIDKKPLDIFISTHQLDSGIFHRWYNDTTSTSGVEKTQPPEAEVF